MTAVEFLEAGGQASLDRCVLVCGDAPVVTAPRPPAAAKGQRQLILTRDVVITRQALLDLAATPTAPPLTVRILGSTLIQLPAAGELALLTLRGAAPTGFPALIDWAGDLNRYLGWNGWLDVASSPNAPVSHAVPNLEAARKIWVAQEGRSREEALPPSARAIALGPWTSDAELAPAVAGDASAVATLARIAAPRADLEARTIGRYPPLPAPARPPETPPRLPTELVFNTAGAPWNGDLGRFLADQLPRRRSAEVVVRVRGQGRHPFTPLQVPDGVSLWIDVIPPTEGGAEPVTWTAPEGASGNALIATRLGDLTIRGARFERGADARLAAVLSVEEGVLRLDACRLLAQGPAEPGGGRLVEFRAPSTRPITPRFTTTEPLANRPSAATARLDRCLLATTGVALDLTMGQGVALIHESAISGASAAIALHPATVVRSRFLVDLQIERSTVASARNLLHIDAWTGSAAGPARPWLVTSSQTVWIEGPAIDTGSSSTLLRGAQGAVELGTVFFQADQDVYQIRRAAARDGDDSPAPPALSTVPDWLDLWGPTHIRQPGGAPALIARFENPAAQPPENLRLAAPANAGAPPAAFVVVAPRTQVALPATKAAPVPPRDRSRPPPRGGTPF